MEDSRATELARAIYKSHAAAIDFIWESKIDLHSEVTGHLIKLFEKEGAELGIVLSKCGKGRIRFVPREWDFGENKNGTAWGPGGHVLLIELDIYNKVSLHILAGDPPLDFTEKLWEAMAF